MQKNKDNLIEEVKNRCNIIDIVGSVVELKRAGRNYKGRCPFHNENTPSFVVSEEKQIFTCFGCNATGDVIEFVRKYYNLDFRESLEKLAEQCGINMDEYNKGSGKRELYYEINREAARFFFKALRENENLGLKYMFERKLSRETLHTFGIGWADEKWNSLYDYLKSKGYKEDDLLKLGLISQSKGRYFDKFRSRVIFPIQNKNGKVVGFGGRSLGENMPKYLNTMETPVFSKKNNLYGFNISKNHISKMDQAILVEGYMDVISLYQGGVKNVVASLGTALTLEQCKLLEKNTNNIILAYDSDSAGQTAALRGGKIIHGQNMKVKILSVTEGKDPDDFIKAKGKIAFYKLVEDAMPFFDYRLKLLKDRHDFSTPEDKIDFVRDVIKILKSYSPVEVDIYIKRVAEQTNIGELAIRNELLINSKIDEQEIRNNYEEPKENINISSLEKNLIKIMMTESSYYEKLRAYSIFESNAGKDIFNGIEKLYIPGNDIDKVELCDLLEDPVADELNNIINNIKLAGQIENIFSECISTYKEEVLVNKEKQLLDRLEMAEEDENSDMIKQITTELIMIQKERNSRG